MGHSVWKCSGIEREFVVAAERPALSCEQEREGWPLSFESGQDLSLQRSAALLRCWISFQ